MSGVEKRNARAMRRVATWVALVVAAGGGLYAAAGLLIGALPSNGGWREPADGVEIWVESNGVHTGVVVPKVAAGVDWRPRLRPDQLRDPRYARYGYAAFGWGERDFYLNTPTWWDVSPRTVLAAATGSDRVLLHVDHLPRPGEDARSRRVVLRPEEYRRLAAFIAASFQPGGQAWRGYGRYDVFYEARGHYSGIATCNAWTGDALRHAGVHVGRWTPFPLTVMWWF